MAKSPFKDMIRTENVKSLCSEDEIMNFCESRYIDMCGIESAFRSNQNEFVILSLNIWRIKAKIDNFLAIMIGYLPSEYFSAPFACRKHGLRPTQFYHYWKCKDINLYTEATSGENTEDFLYILSMILHMI